MDPAVSETSCPQADPSVSGSNGKVAAEPETGIPMPVPPAAAPVCTLLVNNKSGDAAMQSDPGSVQEIGGGTAGTMRDSFCQQIEKLPGIIDDQGLCDDLDFDSVDEDETCLAHNMSVY